MLGKPVLLLGINHHNEWNDYMNLMQIYFELSENKSNEYYIELSKNEVMFLPAVIEIAQDGSYAERKRAADLLEKISETQPYQFAIFAQYIVKAISKHNDFSSWCLWKSVEKVFDLLDVSLVEDEFLKALNSNILGEFSIACDCIENFISSYPKSRNKISDILQNIKYRDFMIDGEVSEICGKIAVEKALNNLSKMEK